MTPSDNAPIPAIRRLPRWIIAAMVVAVAAMARVKPGEATAGEGGPAARTAHEARVEARAAEENALLGPRFRAVGSRWYVLVTDASDERASALLMSLDETADRFLDAASRWSALVRPPAQRMLCVFFSSQDDFRGYAASRDRVDAHWMGGYYSSRRNIVALYDDVNGDQFVEAMGTLPKGRCGDARRSALIREAHEATRAKAVHEAVHLLAYNTGLQSPGATYPAWLTEGLAESFARGAMSGCERVRTAARRCAATLTVGEAGAIVAKFAPPRGSADEIDEFYADSRRLFDALLERAPGELAAFFGDLAMPRTKNGQATDEATVAAMFAARFGHAVGGAEAAARASQAAVTEGR